MRRLPGGKAAAPREVINRLASALEMVEFPLVGLNDALLPPAFVSPSVQHAFYKVDALGKRRAVVPERVASVTLGYGHPFSPQASFVAVTTEADDEPDLEWVLWRERVRSGDHSTDGRAEGASLEIELLGKRLVVDALQQSRLWVTSVATARGRVTIAGRGHATRPVALTPVWDVGEFFHASTAVIRSGGTPMTGIA